jgi:hypothetical protein
MTIPNDLTASAAVLQPQPTSSSNQSSHASDPQENPAASASPAQQATPVSANESTGPASSVDPRTRPMIELRPEIKDALDFLVATSQRNAKDGATHTLQLTAETCGRILTGLELVALVIRQLAPAVYVQQLAAAQRDRRTA